MESWYPAPSLPHWPGQLLKQGGGKVLDPHKLEKEDEVVHIPDGHVWTFMLHDGPAVLDGFEVGDIARLVNQVYVFLCQPLHGRFGCVAGSRQPHPGGSCGTQTYLRSRTGGPGDTQGNSWSSWWCGPHDVLGSCRRSSPKSSEAQHLWRWPGCACSCSDAAQPWASWPC